MGQSLQRQRLPVDLRSRAVSVAVTCGLDEFKTACDDFAHPNLGTQNLERLELYSLAEQRYKDQRCPKCHEEEAASAVVDREQRNAARDEDHHSNERGYDSKPGQPARQ